MPAGSSTLRMVCQRVAPMATEASLSSMGSERRVSALRVVMVGSTITARTTEAAGDAVAGGAGDAGDEGHQR